MRLIYVILLAIFSASIAAERINFTCSGIDGGGEDNSDEFVKFNMVVETRPPFITAPAGYLGCVTLNQNIKMSYSCQINDTEIACKCSGGDFYTSSLITLSRLNGDLLVYKFRKSSPHKGDYSCKKIAKPLF